MGDGGGYTWAKEVQHQAEVPAVGPLDMERVKEADDMLPPTVVHLSLIS